MEPDPPRPPHRVSLTPSTPSAMRRLSSNFIERTRPKPVKKLAWVTFQGRLVGAEEATSARTIGLLDPQQAMAWDLFSPIHRVLVVAVIAVASSKCNKNKEIFRLTKSVQLRDQILLSMQEKLDSLCEQLNNIKDPPGTWADMSIDKNVEPVLKEPMAIPNPNCFGCGCQLCDHHKVQHNDSLGNSLVKGQIGDQASEYRYSLSNASEAEERRMSDMSDWNSSVTSIADTQMNSIAINQDVNNLRKECEEKEATIDELSTLLHSSESFGSKRIAELEDIIRTKNTRITRLKKDMLVLEQKVMQLTRLKRSSSTNMKHIPAMADNVLFDMESTTSPSSSDSDCSTISNPQNSIEKNQKHPVSRSGYFRSGQEAKVSNLLTKHIARKQQKEGSSSSTPLKEKSLNQKVGLISSLSGRRDQSGKKLAASQKRWV